MGHSVPLLVTAGAGKLPAVYYATWPVASILSVYDSALESMGCPLTTTAASTTAALSSTTVASGSTGSGSGQASTGASPSQMQPSTTASSTSDASASPTETPNAASSERFVSTLIPCIIAFLSVYITFEML